MQVLMVRMFRTRWTRGGGLSRRLAKRRARHLAAVRKVIFEKRRILALVPLMVVPPVAEGEQELPAQEVILALPTPNAPSATRAVMGGGLSSSFYRRSGWQARNVFAVRHQPPRQASGSGNGWLEESDDEEQVGDNFDLFRRVPMGNLKYRSLVCINVQDEVLWEILAIYLMFGYACSGPDPMGK
ncbi:hypothetical protein L1987_24204 [Smallanthus sonchifolius]|uniref:Uncharacterized protein n=1 Tax=Smallanthus sonchifolius TaxID=185202 RepID=A0ACB9IL97_9ASTR|nr:hypothetical protein L1987_24204 [Smallanthus sonchifolius]